MNAKTDSPNDIEVISTKFQLAITIRDQAKVAEIPRVTERNLRDLSSYIQRNGVKVSGPPFTFYHGWSSKGVDLENGYPVAGEVKVGGRIRSFNLPAVRAVTAIHTGPYEGLREVYSRMEKWMKDNGHPPALSFWEVHLNDPLSTEPEKRIIQIIWPIK
jgi:effector-binding domain-containing protein